MIQGITAVESRRIVGRADEGWGETGYVRGLEATVKFNEDQFAGNSVYLLASVLERFFGMYVSINSFANGGCCLHRQSGAELEAMGEPGRREDPPVSKQLLEEPWRFGFFQGTRLLEWIAARARRSKSAGVRFRNTDASVGGDLPAGQEAVRFRATASPRFPADEVLAILPPTDVVRNAGALPSPPILRSRS